MADRELPVMTDWIALLNAWDDAVAEQHVATVRKIAVKNQIAEALGLRPYEADDKLLAALVRKVAAERPHVAEPITEEATDA